MVAVGLLVMVESAEGVLVDAGGEVVGGDVVGGRVEVDVLEECDTTDELEDSDAEEEELGNVVELEVGEDTTEEVV